MYPTHDPDAYHEGCCWSASPDAEAVIAAFERLAPLERDCVLVELLCRTATSAHAWPQDEELDAADYEIFPDFEEGETEDA